MRRIARLFALVLLAASCQKFDRLLEGADPFDGSLAVAVPPGTVTAPLGSEQVFTATVTRRGEFKSDVALTIDGLPSGVTATISTTTSSGLLTTATVTIRVGSSAKIGNYVLTVRAHAEPSTSASTLLSLAITETPSFALTPSASSFTIARGGVAPITIDVARTNLTAPISLALTGAAGITATFTPNPITADAATGTISVPATAPTGTAQVTLRGTAAGASDQSINLSINVIADPLQLIAPATATAGQGSTLTLPIVINRGSYSGAVTWSAQGLPTGTLAAFSPTSATGGTATVALAVGATTAPGVYQIRLIGSGSGVPDATATVELTVTAASIAIAIDPTAVSVFQSGTGANAKLRVTRTGFTGNVMLAFEGAPIGVTLSAQPAVVDGDSTIITVAASTAATPAQFDVTIRATPAGFPASASKTATLNVTVRAAPPGGGNVLLDWSRCAAPDWVAYQDATGPWTQAPVAGGVARFSILGGRGGIAYVESGTSMTVRYGLQAEFTNAPLDMCPALLGTKTISGFSSFGATLDQMTYSLGGGTATSSGASPAFTIGAVQNGTHDLIGWGTLAVFGRRGLIRRDVNLPSGGSLGVVDPLGGESFIPSNAFVTWTGVLPGELASNSMTYLTTDACTATVLYQNTPNATMFGVSSGVQRPSDYHMLTVVSGSGSRQRSVSTVFHTLANKSVALPVATGASVVSALTGSYKRLQMVIPGTLQPLVYNGSILFRYNDGATKTMSVSASIAYQGTSTVLQMPDLSGVSGWQTSYAIAASATGNWTVAQDGASAGPLCSENKTLVTQTQSGRY
jgi:hypothetical protein